MKLNKREMNKHKLNIIIISLLPVFFYFFVKWLVTNNPHSICLFKFITGHECWGCGMTRAFNALFGMQFSKAYEYNPRIIIVAPLMVGIWLQTLIKAIKTPKKQYINVESIKK